MLQEKSYENFDLLIHPHNGDFRARVTKSPVGKGITNFTRVTSTSTKAEVIGAMLFQAVFSGDVFKCFSDSLTLMRSQRKGLRIRLVIDEADELQSLPWEALYDPKAQKFLALSIETPIVRCLEVQDTLDNRAISLPIRILVASASPVDYEPLQVTREWRSINKALESLKTKKAVFLESCTHTTRAKLHSKIAKQFHVFHFQGHGNFDADTKIGVLILEKESGTSDPLTATELGQLLVNQKSIQIAILNACKSANNHSETVYTGIAQSLVKTGIPIVIAMSGEIYDETAITFAKELYTLIAEGVSIEYALTNARMKAWVESKKEWMLPVLFSSFDKPFVFDEAITEIQSLPHVTEIISTAGKFVKANLAILETGISLPPWTLSEKLKEAGALLQHADHLDANEYGQLGLWISQIAFILLQMITPSDPNDRANDFKTVIRLKLLMDESSDVLEKYQLAVCYLYWATAVQPPRIEAIQDARRIFTRLEKFNWVSNCDKALSAIGL